MKENTLVNDVMNYVLSSSNRPNTCYVTVLISFFYIYCCAIECIVVVTVITTLTNYLVYNIVYCNMINVADVLIYPHSATSCSCDSCSCCRCSGPRTTSHCYGYSSSCFRRSMLLNHKPLD